jgi:hypothetical protein
VVERRPVSTRSGPVRRTIRQDRRDLPGRHLPAPAQEEELDKQEELLSQQIACRRRRDCSVTRQVDKVEAIRAHMNKMRTLMLLKERQVLSPDQRVKLNKLHEQWERDHKRPSRGDVK